MPGDGLTEESGRLTREEDDELRRLHWFSQIGMLSHAKKERLIELRLRDRRREIRPPREFGEEDAAPTKRRHRFLVFSR